MDRADRGRAATLALTAHRQLKPLIASRANSADVNDCAATLLSAAACGQPQHDRAAPEHLGLGGCDRGPLPAAAEATNEFAI
ncbi:MAG: hypothetical protein ACLP0J_22080 [Solirubrobacteraceae bacterium]